MTAESLTTALETLTLGEPWSEGHRAAADAIAADRNAAIAALFSPELTPTTADAIAEYTWRTSRLGALGFGQVLADMHARAVISHPELARLLRSFDAIEDVEANARAIATPNERETQAKAGARAAMEARAKYMAAIARQLAASPGHELEKPAIAFVACEALADRLAIAKAQHEEHARAELARAEEERRAAERVVVDKTVQRVRAAAAAAEDARAKATLAEREYRALRSEAFVLRMRAARIDSLRVDGNLYSAAQLIGFASNNDFSVAQLDQYEAALAREGAA